MTVRRRFLLASSLARLIQRERGGLRQVEGFFPAQRDRASWVRLEENRALLILRTAGPDGDVEEQTEIPVAHAHALLDVCAGEIDYIRTKLPIGDRMALVDHIIQPRALHLVSIEFANETEASGFRPLTWFGPEVTGDARYTNQALALKGFGEVPDISLSNAALNGLIDTLENRFETQPRIPVTRPMTSQVSRAESLAGPGPGNGPPVRTNLNEVEAAMMREMARRLPHNRTS